MKEVYTKPELDIIEFSCADVIMTSIILDEDEIGVYVK